MGVIDFLKKSEKLVFWNRCRLHSGKEDFRRMVINGYHNPDFLELRHYGDEYPGCIVYDASETGNGIGFFAEFGMMLSKLYYADDRGMVPYICWGEDFVFYEPEGIRGEKNAFLHYFEPASEVKSVNHAAHVVHQQTWHWEQVRASYETKGYQVSQEYVYAMARVLKKYIRYNQETETYLRDAYEGLLGDRKTLAVHYRGTDFSRGYNNHPIPVRIEQEIQLVRELLESGSYEQIFLATDEVAAVERFRQEFGDKIKIYEDTFRDDGSGESVAFSESDREDHHYRLGLEVLRDQYTLTRCEGLICGHSSIISVARVMRGAWYERPWEDFCLIDNGIYHNSNRFDESGHARRK